MRICKHVLVLPTPFGGPGNDVPVVLRQQFRGDVQLQQVRAAGKHHPDLIVDQLFGAFHLTRLGPIADHQTVRHQCIERIQRPAVDHVAVHKHVTIGDPLFPPGALAMETGVSALPPDIVRMEQKVGRGPGPCGGADVHRRIHLPEFRNQPEHGIHIIGQIALGFQPPGRTAAAHPVKLEEVNAIVLHHLHTAVSEAPVIHQAGQGKAAGIDFIPMLPAIIQSNLLGMTIAAKG